MLPSFVDPFNVDCEMAFSPSEMNPEEEIWFPNYIKLVNLS